MKPYYDDGKGIQIFHGDCREILPGLPKVDLVLTDPPYGADWNTDYSRFSRGAHDKPKVSGDSVRFDIALIVGFGCEMIIWGANYHGIREPGGYLIWDKRCEDGFAFLSDAEVAWWSASQGCYIFAQNAQRHRSSEAGLHPTQKPIALMRWCIGKARQPQTILDPFMGSGTTLVAAKQLGRKAIGIEIEERYCEIAVKRLAQEVFDFNEPEPKPKDGVLIPGV